MKKLLICATLFSLLTSSLFSQESHARAAEAGAKSSLPPSAILVAIGAIAIVAAVIIIPNSGDSAHSHA